MAVTRRFPIEPADKEPDSRGAGRRPESPEVFLFGNASQPDQEGGRREDWNRDSDGLDDPARYDANQVHASFYAAGPHEGSGLTYVMEGRDATSGYEECAFC